MSTEEQKSIKAGDSIMLVLRGIHGSNVYSGSYVTDSPTFHNCFADDCIDETTGICNRCGNFLGVDNISQYHDFINDVYSKYYFIHNGTYNLYFRTIAVPYLHKMYLDWDNLDIYSDGHAYSDGKEIGDGIFDPNSYGYGAIREYNAANPVRSLITYVVSVDSTAVDGAEECFYGGCGPCDDYDASNDFFECRYCTYSYTEELHEPTWNYGDSAGFNTFLISEPYMAYAYSLKLSSSCKIKFGKGNSDADYKLEFYMDHTLIATMDKGVSEFITSTLPAGEYTLIARSDEAQEDMSKTNVGKTLGFAYGLAN